MAATARRTPLVRDVLVLGTLALVAVVDQLSKYAITLFLPEGHSFPQVGPVRLTYVTNTGQTFFLTVASVGAIAALLVFYRFYSAPKVVARFSLGLLLGGSLGNLVDRVRLGYVVDFVDLRWWPVFNLADASVVVGLLLFIASLPPPRVRSRPTPRAPGAPPPEVGC